MKSKSLGCVICTMESMQGGRELPGTRALLRHAYNTMPRRRFWRIVVTGICLGVLTATPFVVLLISHEGNWTGFLWDLLFRLPFVLMCVGFVVLIVRAARERKWKDVLQGVLVLTLFGTITSFVTLEFAHQLRGLIHFRGIQSSQVSTVAVECHSTTDSVLVSGIIADLRRAEWYSPASHGWAPYATLTLVFTDGRVEVYTLTEVLAEGRLVVHPAPGNSGLLAVPHLSDSLQRAGLLNVSSHPRYDNKGFYEAIVPSSVCKNPPQR